MEALAGRCRSALKALPLRLPAVTRSSQSAQALAGSSELLGVRPNLYSFRWVALPPKLGSAAQAPDGVTAATVAVTATVAAALEMGILSVQHEGEPATRATAVTPSVPAAAVAAGAAAASPAGVAAATAAEGTGEQPRGDGQLEVHVIDLGHALSGTAPPGPKREAIASLARDLGRAAVIGLDAEWEPELLQGESHR
jgi:hypothetical protein